MTGVLADLSAPSWRSLVAPAGTFILPPGRSLRDGDLALLLAGRMAIHCEEPDGRTVGAGYLDEGSLLGLAHRLGSVPPLRLTAVNMVKIATLSRGALEVALSNDATLACALIRESDRQHDIVVDHLRLALFALLRRRLCRHLIMLSIGNRPVRQTELAHYVGATREAVCRQVSAMRTQRLVASTDAGLVILDHATVSRLAGCHAVARDPDHSVGVTSSTAGP